MARSRKTTIVRSRKSGLKFQHNKAKIDFANLRPVTRDEAKKFGATPGTLFAARGKRITKNAIFVSLRQVKEHRTSEFLGQSVSLERAAKLRKQSPSNASLYHSADMRERAAKVRRTREIQRLAREFDHIDRVHDLKGDAYRVSPENWSRYQDLRRRKLDGGWIEPGDWHWMLDVARQLNDPQEPFLRMYPASFAAVA
jgi:hypothetical protein